MVEFLRKNAFACCVLTLFRLYLGWAWIQAGWEKLSQGNFDSAGFLQGAKKKATGDHPAVQSWRADFLSGVALPNASFCNKLIPWGEL